MSLPEPARGRVTAVAGKTLTLEGSGELIVGDRLHLKFPTGAVYAIPITHVEAAGSTVRVTLQCDPCLELADDGRSGVMTVFPNHRLDCEVTYRSPRSVTYVRER